MTGFNFFFHVTDPFLLFSQKLFPLGTFPLFPHKGIQDKDLNHVDHKQKGPEGNRPHVPVMGFPVFQDLVYHNQKDTSDQKNHKMPEQPFFLPYPALGMLQEFMLLRIQGWPLFLFEDHPFAYL